MRFREAHAGQYAGLGLAGQDGEPGHLGPDLVGHRALLGTGGLGRVIGEGGEREDANHLPVALSGVSQHMPHDVDPAALPARREHLGDSGLEALVGAGDDAFQATHAATRELAQELRPAGLDLPGAYRGPGPRAGRRR